MATNEFLCKQVSLNQTFLWDQYFQVSRTWEFYEAPRRRGCTNALGNDSNHIVSYRKEILAKEESTRILFGEDLSVGLEPKRMRISLPFFVILQQRASKSDEMRATRPECCAWFPVALLVERIVTTQLIVELFFRLLPRLHCSISTVATLYFKMK